jgi:hypothetical protein
MMPIPPDPGARMRQQLLAGVASLLTIIDQADQLVRAGGNAFTAIPAAEARHVRDRLSELLDHRNRLDQLGDSYLAELILEDAAMTGVVSRLEQPDHAEAARLALGVAARRAAAELGIPAGRLPDVLAELNQLVEPAAPPEHVGACTGCGRRGGCICTP